MKLESQKYGKIVSFIIIILGLVSAGYAEKTQSPQEYLQITGPAKTFHCPSDETLKNYVKQMKDKSIFHVEIADASRVTDTGMTALAELPIRSLTITQGKFDGKCLAQFKELGILYLFHCTGLTDEGVASILKIPSLLELAIWEAPNITSAGFEKFSEMKQLRRLMLRLEQFNESWISSQKLENLSTLEAIVITGIVGKDIFEVISRFPNLKSVYVSNWEDLLSGVFLSKEPIKQAKGWPWNWNDIVKPLGKLQHLESLEIMCEFDDNKGDSFFPPNFAQLKTFATSDMNISDEFFDKMYERMTHLELLNIPAIRDNVRIVQKFMERNPALDIYTLFREDDEWAIEGDEESEAEEIEEGEETEEAEEEQGK